MADKAINGKEVQIHYTGKLEDGSVFDSSDGREPLTFVLGAGQVIPGFEEGIEGMEVGSEKDLVIPQEKAYGERREELVQDIPKDKLGELKPELNMVIGMQVPGVPQVFPAKIIEIKDNGDVRVDLNPPLAGQTLHFHIKLEAVNEPSEHVHACGDCSCGEEGCGDSCSCEPELDDQTKSELVEKEEE